MKGSRKLHFVLFCLYIKFVLFSFQCYFIVIITSLLVCTEVFSAKTDAMLVQKDVVTVVIIRDICKARDVFLICKP